MVRTEGGTPDNRTSSLITLGTVLMRVTGTWSPASANARVSRSRKMLPPAANETKISKTDKSKQMEVPASVHASSSREYRDCAQNTRFTTLRWRMRTPLGRPDEPEV